MFLYTGGMKNMDKLFDVSNETLDPDGEGELPPEADICQCSLCEACFQNIEAFDAHRVGGRCCLDGMVPGVLAVYRPAGATDLISEAESIRRVFRGRGRPARNHFTFWFIG
jgi:hypothetical protein